MSSPTFVKHTETTNTIITAENFGTHADDAANDVAPSYNGSTANPRKSKGYCGCGGSSSERVQKLKEEESKLDEKDQEIAAKEQQLKTDLCALEKAREKNNNGRRKVTKAALGLSDKTAALVEKDEKKLQEEKKKEAREREASAEALTAVNEEKKKEAEAHKQEKEQLEATIQDLQKKLSIADANVQQSTVEKNQVLASNAALQKDLNIQAQQLQTSRLAEEKVQTSFKRTHAALTQVNGELEKVKNDRAVETNFHETKVKELQAAISTMQTEKEQLAVQAKVATDVINDLKDISKTAEKAQNKVENAETETKVTENNTVKTTVELKSTEQDDRKLAL